MPTKNVFVTQPFLPPLSEFLPFLEKIWESKILTNCGPFHTELETQLCRLLEVPFISLTSNATVGLLTALRALKISGDVITTPFTFVATGHSLLWNDLKPVFVDIDPHSFNLNPQLIERAITPSTTAILPVHCYGNPCNYDAINVIAKKYGLKVIYDAAHAFGVRDQIGGILKHGDLSVLSFHATKVFNTFEGGAIVCHSKEMKEQIDQLKNFGHMGETSVIATGINGKMSEFNAALGLLQLKYVQFVSSRRQEVDLMYRSGLKSITGIRLLEVPPNVQWNFAYFPIQVEGSYPGSRDQLYNHLKENGIHPRRYFYPLISEFPMYKTLPSAHSENLPIAHKVARQIICLPIYPDLDMSYIQKTIQLICSFNPG